MKLGELQDLDAEFIESSVTTDERRDVILALVQEYQRASPDKPPYRVLTGVPMHRIEIERSTMRAAAKRAGWTLQTSSHVTYLGGKRERRLYVRIIGRYDQREKETRRRMMDAGLRKNRVEDGEQCA